MTPKWLSQSVAAFGRALGLTTFALNERGVAALRFKSGVEFRMEVAEGGIVLIVSIPAENLTAEQACRFLGESHPYFQPSVGRVRVAFLAPQQKILLTLSVLHEKADETTLDQAFRELWNRGERVRRSLWD